jgi:Ca-activated chloride channel family protein
VCALGTCGVENAARAQTSPSPRSGAPRSGAVFHSQTDLVVLQVTVVDQRHRFVGDLRLEDFGVYEEGVKQNVMMFGATDVPLDVMVLLDTSDSMTGRIEIAQRAAINLLRLLRVGDRAAVVLFSSNVRVVSELTDDIATLEAAIRGARPAGATALYEALYIAQRELSRVRRNSTELRRQALVVLSDGDDNMSSISFDDVLDETRRGDVTIFTILPTPGLGPPPEHLRQQRVNVAFVMRRLAEDTGGRTFTPAAADDLLGVYQDIAEELRQQYWLAYTPASSALNGFRRVSVRVETRPDLRARTRQGYDAGRPRRTTSLGPRGAGR